MLENYLIGVLCLRLHVAFRLDQHFAEAKEGNDKTEQTAPVDHASCLVAADDDFPASGWLSIAAGRLVSAFFTMQTIVSFFLDSATSDGAAGNFKALSATDIKSIRLFHSGYGQKIEVCKVDGHVFYKARCQPEMRTKTDYRIKLAVLGDPEAGRSVTFASCTCPAGKGPKASCKHIAALMYALEEFSCIGYTRDTVTCTDKLQARNKPASKKSEPMMVKEMEWRKGSAASISIPSAGRKRKHSAAEVQDPRAVTKRGYFAEEVKTYVDKALRQNDPPMGLTLVAGSSALATIDKERRLESATKKKQEWQVDCDTVTPVPSDDGWLTEEEKQRMWYEVNVVVTREEARSIERATLVQSASGIWMAERKKRITASIAHSVARRRLTTDPKSLVSRIVDRPAFPTPTTEWGIENENKARSAYIAHLAEASRHASVSSCGFVIHPTECWLGASPDGISVEGDESVLLEIKCPYLAKEQSLLDLARDHKPFCLGINEEGSLSLKSSHAYYTQVQIQMYCASVRFCDFIVWSPSDLFVR